MQIAVLIEPVVGNGFRASGGEPFAITAEGATPYEALGKLREMIEERVAAGAQIAALELRAEEHPWSPFAGALKDDPLLEDWKKAMLEYRLQTELDPDIP